MPKSLRKTTGWTHYAEGQSAIDGVIAFQTELVNANRAVAQWRANESQQWKQKAKEKDGKTPLYFATQRGHKDVAEMLRKHGGLEFLKAQSHIHAEATHGRFDKNAKAVYSLGGRGPNGGTIVRLDSTGCHGLEANSKDSQSADSGGVMWSDAGAALARTEGGRLPTIEELESLAKMQDEVGGFKKGQYWSSDRAPGSSFLCWTVTFPFGTRYKLRAFHDSYRGIDGAYVRGVHDF